MTVLSFIYGIITDRAIYLPGYGENGVDVINAIEKCYWKEQMELLGK